MSLTLENINVVRTFSKAVDMPIIQETSLSLDRLEFVWGLNRGQIMSYFNLVPGNVLRLQPELKKAIEKEQVALCPPLSIVKKLSALQARNMKLPLSKRRMFTEAIPFKPYEYRVVPIKKGVILFSRDPTTRKVSFLTGPSASASDAFPLITLAANPAFVLSYASDGLLEPPDRVRCGLALGPAIDDCLGPWQTVCPPLEFYARSYVGEFGRSVPVKYRDQVPKTRPVAVVVDSKKEEEEKENEGEGEDGFKGFEELHWQPILRNMFGEGVGGGEAMEVDCEMVDCLETALLDRMRM